MWDEEIDLRKVEFTPGFGIRYFSPIGPIRIDLGYRFQGEEPLRVVTRRVILPPDGATGEVEVSSDELIRLATPVLWGDRLGRWSFRRFEFHLSIGQAF